MNKTINKLKSIVYVALDFTTGLTDVTLAVRNPSGGVFATIIMTEQADGIYTASYTPDALGNWQEKVTSVTNNDKVIRAYEVVSYDTDDVKVQTDSIETKVDTVDGKIDIIDSNVDSTQTDVTTIKGKTDNLPVDTASDLTNIKTVVDNISTEINPGGHFAG